MIVNSCEGKELDIRKIFVYTIERKWIHESFVRIRVYDLEHISNSYTEVE